jgi:hypothetical protein
MRTDLRLTNWDEIRSSVKGKREKVYLSLLTYGPSTPKELAEKMGWDKCSVRPRISELCAMFHALATNERRNGEHVFAALSHAEAHLVWSKHKGDSQ